MPPQCKLHWGGSEFFFGHVGKKLIFEPFYNTYCVFLGVKYTA